MPISGVHVLAAEGAGLQIDDVGSLAVVDLLREFQDGSGERLGGFLRNQVPDSLQSHRGDLACGYLREVCSVSGALTEPTVRTGTTSGCFSARALVWPSSVKMEW